MNRKKFISIAGASLLVAGGVYYLCSDKRNFIRADIQDIAKNKSPFTQEEKAILYLASLAPSGHNAQPWLVKYIEPYHWIIGNDSTRWLMGVDPTQRETMLSIGAFLQNLEYAANQWGYNCVFTIIATTNQDENVVYAKLTKAIQTSFVTQKIVQRRTIRSNYLNDVLKKEDIAYLINDDKSNVHYVSNTMKEHHWLNEQTIEANRIQAYRDDAEKELANWIRFTSKDAKAHCDGLTVASMEIEGISAWYLRSFYDSKDVMKKGFREKSINTANKQVASSAGWIVITSKDNAVSTLLETGKRLQRIWLKVRERNIAIHPMSQILEEYPMQQTVQSSLGLSDSIQFLLRVGYVSAYPAPVSLRRPIDWIVK